MEYVLLAALAILIVWYHSRGRRAGRNIKKNAFPSAGTGRGGFARGPMDAAEQLRAVMAASFHRKTIMSKTEYRVFRLAEEMARGAGNGHRVFAQVSLGEVIGSADAQAFKSINSKRVDILMIDCFGNPVAAIEYQGSGHYQNDAAARDAVKREALRRAGVPFIEVAEQDDEDEIRHKIRAALNWPAPNTAEAVP